MSKQSEDDIKRRYPISGSVAGWFFRVREESPGHFLAEGLDVQGRTVSYSGGDGNQLLARCMDYARELQRKSTDSDER